MLGVCVSPKMVLKGVFFFGWISIGCVMKLCLLGFFSLHVRRSPSFSFGIIHLTMPKKNYEESSHSTPLFPPTNQNTIKHFLYACVPKNDFEGCFFFFGWISIRRVCDKIMFYSGFFFFCTFERLVLLLLASSYNAQKKL